MALPTKTRKTRIRDSPRKLSRVKIRQGPTIIFDFVLFFDFIRFRNQNEGIVSEPLRRPRPSSARPGLLRPTPSATIVGAVGASRSLIRPLSANFALSPVEGKASPPAFCSPSDLNKQVAFVQSV